MSTGEGKENEANKRELIVSDIVSVKNATIQLNWKIDHSTIQKNSTKVGAWGKVLSGHFGDKQWLLNMLI